MTDFTPRENRTHRVPGAQAGASPPAPDLEALKRRRQRRLAWAVAAFSVPLVLLVGGEIGHGSAPRSERRGTSIVWGDLSSRGFHTPFTP